MAPAEAPRQPRRAISWLPLAVILVAQALLSVRLLRTSPVPSGDEGLYIYSGHQLIYEFWHGGGSPYYETYFSGAPVIYPVLAAMADHVGGLTGVRLMSLEFMLSATCSLFGTARRLLGYWPAVTAAGLFATSALTQDLGVYATFDAMSLALIAFAAYCAVRAEAGSAHEGSWLLSVPVAVLLANATKYATIAFDPVVFALAAYATSVKGWRTVLQRFVVLSLTTCCLLGIACYVAGRAYITGAFYTTLARNSASQALLGGARLEPASVIVSESARAIGVQVSLGVLAVLLALVMRDGRRALLFLVMVLAGLLITVEALKLHTDQSMLKHDDFGIWFTCIAAGGIAACLPGRGSRAVQVIAAMFSGLTVAVSAVYFAPRAAATYMARPNPDFIEASVFLRAYVDHPGRFLIGGLVEDSMLYSQHVAIPWWRYTDDQYFKYPIPGRGGDEHGRARGLACADIRPGCVYLEGTSAYREAIRHHWFSLISLVGSHGATPQDAVILQTVEHTPGYVLLSQVGGAPTWIYVPDYQH